MLLKELREGLGAHPQLLSRFPQREVGFGVDWTRNACVIRWAIHDANGRFSAIYNRYDSSKVIGNVIHCLTWEFTIPNSRAAN